MVKKLLSVILMLVFCSVLSSFPLRLLETPEDMADSGAVPLVLTAQRPTLETDALLPGGKEDLPPAFYTISLLGDCTLASSIYNVGISSSYNNVVGDNYAYPFEKTVHLLNDDDFTIANLECALTEHNVPANKNFVFKAAPEYVNILKEGSVEFVTLGNNHVDDFGKTGYEDTKAALEGAEIGYSGRGEHIICDVNGLLIGIYADSFGSTADLKKGIAALKDAGAEFIITALHWGDEGSYKPNNIQISQGRAAIDAGADLVYGSHTHTLQPIEEYEGKYIFYSMGNWSFGGNTNPRDKDTVIAKLELVKNADGVSVTALKLIPCASSGVQNGNNYQPVPYEEDSEEYARVLTKLDGTFSGSNLSVNYEYDFNEY